MTFNDTDLYCQILGSVMKDPSVLGSLPMPIAIDDFSTENQIARVVFFSLSNLIDSGVIDPWMVTKSALRNAGSVAGLILTSEAIVSDEEELKTIDVSEKLPTL